MKAKIIPTLVNTAANTEMLIGIPERRILDLSVVYRIIEEDEDGFSAALMTEEILTEMKMSFEEMEAIAAENFKREYKALIFELTETFKVITNRDRLFGATGLLYEELLAEAAASFGGDFYILPASVHELMLVPDGTLTVAELTEILREGNERIASAEEFLSDNIYRYSDGKLELISA